MAATALFLLALKLAPATLNALWMCFWVFNSVRLANFLWFWFVTPSPLQPDGGQRRPWERARAPKRSA